MDALQRAPIGVRAMDGRIKMQVAGEAFFDEENLAFLAVKFNLLAVLRRPRGTPIRR